MKKIALHLFALASLTLTLSLTNSSTAMAQENNGSGFYSEPYTARNNGSFDRDASVISLSYGFPNATFDNSQWDNGFGPFYLHYEKGIIDEVGIGGYLGFAYSSQNASTYKNHAFGLGLGVLGYYHFNKFIPIDNLDVYVGLGLGLSTAHYSYDANNPVAVTPNYFHFNVPLRAGVRYYVTPGFGVFIEGGSNGLSYANAGVSFKLH